MTFLKLSDRMMTVNLDPRIGTLCRNGEMVYYAHIPVSNADRFACDGSVIYVEHSDPAEVAAHLSRGV